MINRYSRPEMANIWSEENKYRAWLEVEILADEAWAELGEIPKEDVASEDDLPLYFNLVPKPHLWEIRSSNVNGEILDMGKKRANIFYRQPTLDCTHATFVQSSGWMIKVVYALLTFTIARDVSLHRLPMMMLSVQLIHVTLIKIT